MPHTNVYYETIDALIHARLEFSSGKTVTGYEELVCALEAIADHFEPDDDNTIAIGSAFTKSYIMPCPYCDREETLDTLQAAHAWAVGHILEEHEMNLPDFDGVEAHAH